MAVGALVGVGVRVTVDVFESMGVRWCLGFGSGSASGSKLGLRFCQRFRCVLASLVLYLSYI